MAKWRVISTPTCVYCSRAKALLAVRGIDFEEEVLVTDLQFQRFRAAGHSTVPQIFHGDVHVGGSDKLKAYLDSL